ncbi:signal transduction histidine kinase (STHK), LytS [Gloeothece citriformis PCC 7424]|uniref:Signal transduction histidine kinase (STHK), LytS n=1 Tax=Gloeothece citriformis (strain PCC 7424) TaxID=65393 RepID=B7KHA0_GLOC7|nr:general stress protein [Gloeothece citriformis]ACK69309.1 signal transduction histidine kinase (STHK), LytS [Gloeothece citriformis PCC 7424]
MVTSQELRAIGTFPNRLDAEDALNDLRSSGFDMNRVSILAKDTDKSEDIGGARVRDRDHDRGDNEAQEGAGIGAVAGTVLGGIGGLLVGLEALLIPGVGPFFAAGTIATTLAGAGIGAAAGSLVGALTGLGIPEEDAHAYSDRVSSGHYLVMVEGSADDINRAQSILRNHDIKGWNVYDTSTGRRYDYDVNQVNTVVEREQVRTPRTAPVEVQREDIRTRRTTDDEIVEVVDHRNEVL